MRRRALVVLPTYNERENLGPITGRILAASAEVDVLVVDDNSPDGTGRLADEIAAREARVKVLHRSRKEGLGRAYLAAFAIALSDGYELLVEMDADFSHDPKYLPEMLARAKDADLVIGSRNVAGGGTSGWGLGRLGETAELLTSELVTNALLYTEGPISVRLLRDRTLLCEVYDGSETVPRLRLAAEDDDGGRGLRLVKELSNRWGTRRTTTGKTVWFELRLEPQADF